MTEIKKIVIIGPESTGKSTLCEQLAQYYHTRWVPEFARQYLYEHGNKYTYNDLLTIAQGQVALEEHYTSELQKSLMTAAQQSSSRGHRNAPLLFIDTDMYVMKIWSEFVFGNCHPYILNQLVQRKYDLYLLCNTDLAWVKDDLREYPDLVTREKLYRLYKEHMLNQPIPWIDISGVEEERFQKAIAGIESQLFATHS